MDDDLEEIRKKKLQQLQQQQQMMSSESLEEEQQKQKELEQQRQTVLRAILTTEARERLGRIKIARPEIVENLENQLIMLAQSGRLQAKITDEQLKELLQRLMPKKRDIKIKKTRL